MIGGIADITPTTTLPNASNNGDSNDKAYAKGIIAAPNSAIRPIPIRTNTAVPGLPNAAKPADNPVKLALNTAPSPGIDINVKNGIANIPNANAGAAISNVSAPNIPCVICAKPLPKLPKFSSNAFNLTLPKNNKNGIPNIDGIAAMANVPSASEPIKVADI